MREVRWERMFPDELEQAFAACPAIYYAYGLCEPHGPQNTLGLDALKAHGILCRLARRRGGIVAPPDYWHVHELGGYGRWSETAIGQVARPWLTAVPPWIHFRNICYHIRTADALGSKAVLLLTGHYGPNWQDLKTLCDLLQPHVGARLLGLPDFEANQPGFDGDQATGDHAGKVETSLLWAVEPDCVDFSRLPSDMDAPHFAMGKSAGQANRLIGERMVADEVAWLAARVGELIAEFDRLTPSTRLQTFDQVEQLWRDVVAPAVPDFRSMQDRWGEQPEIPADSVWYRNQPVPADWR